MLASLMFGGGLDQPVPRYPIPHVRFFMTAVITFISHGFSGFRLPTPKLLQAAALAAVGSGCLGFIIGAVRDFSHLGEWPAVGQTVAFGLLSAFYGTLIGLVCLPMMRILETKNI